MAATKVAVTDPLVVELVDALVEAIDTDRDEAVERVRSALAPFGGSGLFSAEMRLNGRSSEAVWAFLAGPAEEVVG